MLCLQDFNAAWRTIKSASSALIKLRFIDSSSFRSVKSTPKIRYLYRSFESEKLAKASDRPTRRRSHSQYNGIGWLAAVSCEELANTSFQSFTPVAIYIPP